jgi:hypothetical protein
MVRWRDDEFDIQNVVGVIDERENLAFRDT